MKEFVIVMYILIYFVELYFFGLQRATLLISREFNLNYKDYKSFLLPDWNYFSLISSIIKYLLLVGIIFYYGWWIGGAIWIGSFILSTIFPFPYKFLYRNSIVNSMYKNSIRNPQFASLMIKINIESKVIG